MKGLSTFGKRGYSLKDAPSVRGKVYVNDYGELVIGRQFSMIGRPWASQLTVDKGAKLLFGHNVFINAGCGIAATTEIRIGNDVRIGPRTSIMDSDYHRLDADVMYHDLKKPVIIGDNVWIGTRCTILAGVTIGKNSVVAAGSIVIKDVPENVVVAGAPAKVIRELNTPDGWVRG
ncbi:acetyltransferase [Paenibacillus beijingensis]|uniref:Acetyltransferase n=1 Tax=Paenibacillus beijingensis TaxID=1126833 RepID=A0A0D5NS02_9BACL|nr:acetyltransferase [Paenibacillus beijingensis]